MLKKQEITAQHGKWGRISVILFSVLWIFGTIWFISTNQFGIRDELDDVLWICVDLTIILAIWSIIRMIRLYDLYIIGDDLHIDGLTRKGKVPVRDIESYELNTFNSKLTLKTNSDFGIVIPFYVHGVRHELAEKTLNRAINRTVESIW